MKADEQMTITVRLGEPLWRRVGAKEIDLELPPGSTVADLLSLLSQQQPAIEEFLSDEELPPTVFLGDQLADSDTPLTDGARAMLVWAIAGG